MSWKPLTLNQFAQNIFRSWCSVVLVYIHLGGKQKKTLVIWCLSHCTNPFIRKLTFGDCRWSLNTPLSSLIAEMVENDSLEEHRSNIIYLWYTTKICSLSPALCFQTKMYWPLLLPLNLHTHHFWMKIIVLITIAETGAHMSMTPHNILCVCVCAFCFFGGWGGYCPIAQFPTV